MSKFVRYADPIGELREIARDTVDEETESQLWDLIGRIEESAEADAAGAQDVFQRGRASVLDGIDALAERHGPQLFLLEDEDGDFHAYKHLNEDGSGLLASNLQDDERGGQLSGALLAALKTLTSEQLKDGGVG